MHILDLVHGVRQALVIRRDRLAAVLIVNFDSVVIGRIMRGRDVNPTCRLEPANYERQFGSTQKRLIGFRLREVRHHSIAGIDLTCQFGDRPRRYSQQGMITSQKAVYPREIVEHANIVGDDDREFLAGESRRQVITVTLHGHGRSGRVKSIRPITNPAAPPTSAKGKHLPEGIEEQRHVRFVQMPGQSIRESHRHRAFEPSLQSVGGSFSPRTISIG